MNIGNDHCQTSISHQSLTMITDSTYVIIILINNKLVNYSSVLLSYNQGRHHRIKEYVRKDIIIDLLLQYLLYRSVIGFKITIYYLIPFVAIFDHLSRRSGFNPNRSITYSGMQNVGLTSFNDLSAPSIEIAVRPNRVWKGSTISPGRSLNPPVSVSWHKSINFICKLNL